MIQRIQSIFLLLASSSLGSLFINQVSFADFTEPNPSVPASLDGFLNIYDDKILLGAATIAIVQSLIALFYYKNRPNQIKFAWSMIAVIVFFIGLAAWQIKTVGSVAPLKISAIGFISTALAIIFAFMAIRYIRKDELLVRSADRLR
jgi:hypothetical protein